MHFCPQSGHLFSFSPSRSRSPIAVQMLQCYSSTTFAAFSSNRRQRSKPAEGVCWFAFATRYALFCAFYSDPLATWAQIESSIESRYGQQCAMFRYAPAYPLATEHTANPIKITRTNAFDMLQRLKLAARARGQIIIVNSK